MAITSETINMKIQSLLGKFSRGILGLDVRSDAISAVLVKSGLKGIFIEKTDFIPFSESGEGATDLTAAVSQISKNMDISGAMCIVSLPFNHLSLRTFEAPFKEPKKIRQILPFELEPALPSPIDKQIIDFIPLKNKGSENTTSILAAVIDQEELKFYLDHLKQAGIDPEIVTMNGHATAMAMARLKDVENFILADIGLKKILVYMAEAGRIQFIRSFPIPADPSKKIPLITNNMRHTLLTFEEHFPQSPSPDALYVTGRGVDDPRILSVFEESLHISVYPVDFMKEASLSFAEETDERWIAHAMSNPLALCYCDAIGVKGFNFRKGPFANKKFWVDNKADFIKTAILAGLVFLMVISGGFINRFILKQRIADITYEMNAVFKSTFPDKTITQSPLNQMRAEIKAQKNPTALFTEDTETNIRTIDLINELSRLIPDETDVNLTKLVFNAGSVLVSGNTDEFNAIDDIKNRLEKSEMFKTVDISSATRDRSGKRMEFKLKIDLS